MRIGAVKSLSIILANPPQEFLNDTFKSHHEYLIDTLLIHFDDDDDEALQCLIMGK